METKQKCTCKSPNDNTCDFCDAQETENILERAKLNANKQETLEEAAEKYYLETKHRTSSCKKHFIEGANWQAERMYSETQMDYAYDKGFKDAIEKTNLSKETKWALYAFCVVVFIVYSAALLITLIDKNL
jgi:hypothetical protein